IGNDGSGFDGAQNGTVLAIYPHGPALARNPALADHVLELALKTELPAIELPAITELRRQRIAAAQG
ncbi:MAG: glutamine amidotransferase, partial [Microlunatus sp.]|nr:glutamine amidotransferase [Microlunatus sp.]